MGNAWLDFLAEERDKDENKNIPPMELSSHVRHKYDDWKKANGIYSNSVVEDKNKMEHVVEVVVVKKMRSSKKGKKTKRKGKKVRKTRKH